jgi:hypothetical protein
VVSYPAGLGAAYVRLALMGALVKGWRSASCVSGPSHQAA